MPTRVYFLKPLTRPGFALIAAVIITAVLLTLGTSVVSTSTADLQISRAHAATTRAYYLAEAGTAALIQQIESNSASGNAFINGTMTQTNSTRAVHNLFAPGDSVTSYAVSTAAGEAVIYTTAHIPLDSIQTVRRTATTITRALGGAVTDYAMLTGGNNEDLELGLNATISGGILFSNDDVKVQNGAHVNVQNGGRIWAHDKIEVSSGSTLTGSTRQNVPSLPMPAVDFDSSASTAWRRQATRILTPAQFNALPSGTVLSGIIFVNGSPANLRKNLTVQGLLVINGSFKVEQPAQLTITAPASGPAGLLVHSSLEIENNTSIAGLVYASNYLEIEYDDDDTAEPLSVSIRGGIIGRHIVLSRDRPGTANITITHDATLIGRILNDQFNTTSPTINIGHWEEQY